MEKNESPSKSSLSLLNILQGIFYVVVSAATIWSLYLAISNSRLSFKQAELLSTPVVGITDLKTNRFFNPGTKDTYDNIKYAEIKFSIKNTGSVAVKNFKLNLNWKIGNTTLPVTQLSQTQKGIDLLQGMTTFHSLKVTKNIIDKTIASKPEDGLVINYDFTYSNWSEDKTYKYQPSFMLIVADKEPLTFQAVPIAGP